MKRIVLTVMLCFAFLQYSYAQFSADKALYGAKIEKYTRMRNTGAGLSVTGGVLFVVGIAMISSAPSEITYNQFGQAQTTYTGSQAAGGAVAMLAGMGALGAGIPLWIVGAKSKKKYEQKLELSGFRIDPAGGGSAGVRFRF